MNTETLIYHPERSGFNGLSPHQRKAALEAKKHKHPKSREYYRGIYLKSKHWFGPKKAKLFYVKSCEQCGSKSNLDVHHKEYRNLYDVELPDLMILCRSCHDKFHANKPPTKVD